MEKQKLLDLGLTEEQADKVLAENKTQLEGYIPKARFNEVNDTKKKLESDIAERDKQLKTLKESAGDNETLKNDIIKLQNDNATAKATYEKEIAGMKLNGAIETALGTHKAKNITAVKALLDTSKISLDNENLLGFEEQITALKEAEATKFLFGEEAKTETKSPAGTQPGTGNAGANPTAGKSLGDAIAAGIKI